MQVTLGATIFGHKAANTFYLDVTGAGVIVNDLSSVANAIETAFAADMVPVLAGGYDLITIDLVYQSGVGTEIAFTKAVSHSGGRAGSNLPDAAVCHVIDWVISARYRGGHPRWYLAGIVEGDTSNGSDVSSAAQTAVIAGCNSFRNAINAITTTNITAVVMGTVSFQTAGAWRTPPVFRQYTSVKYGNGGKIGNQRRRIHS